MYDEPNVCAWWVDDIFNFTVQKIIKLYEKLNINLVS